MALNTFNLIIFGYISGLILSISALNETDITIVVDDDDLLTDEHKRALIEAMNIRFA